MTHPPTPPSLQYLATIDVAVGKPITVGQTDGGIRRVVPILGGHVEGPLLTGRVLPLGEDFQMLRSTTVSELSARYVIETVDGDRLAVDNRAIRSAAPEILERLNLGEEVDPRDVYFRCTPRIEASGAWAWLADRIIVGTGERRPDSVRIVLFVVE